MHMVICYKKVNDLYAIFCPNSCTGFLPFYMYICPSIQLCVKYYSMESDESWIWVNPSQNKL